MKKLIALLLVCGFAVAFTSCGKKAEEASEATEEVVEDAVDAVEAAVDSATQVIDSVATE